MALPENRPLSEAAVSAYLADVSTASSTFVVSPWRTGANAVWTMEINGTAVTGVSVTITQSGSAAGDVDSGEPTAVTYVNEGDSIEFISDGASSTTAPATFTAVIERD
jgi:hypothetical protein